MMKHKIGLIEEENKILKQVINDTIWMAIRYAHGRKTMAPSKVRTCIAKLKNIDPDFVLNPDTVIEREPWTGDGFKEDYLNDLFDN